MIKGVAEQIDWKRFSDIYEQILKTKNTTHNMDHLLEYKDINIVKIVIQFSEQIATQDQLNQLIENIFSNFVIQWHKGLIGLRQISIQTNEIALLLENDAIQRILFLMDQQEYSHLLLEGLWLLTNLANYSGNIVDKIIQRNINNSLIRSIQSPYKQINEQGIWLIGNLTGDFKLNIQYLYQNNIIKILKENYSRFSQFFNVQYAWIFGNLIQYIFRQRNNFSDQQIIDELKFVIMIYEKDPLNNLDLKIDILKALSMVSTSKLQKTLVNENFLYKIISDLNYYQKKLYDSSQQQKESVFLIEMIFNFLSNLSKVNDANINNILLPLGIMDLCLNTIYLSQTRITQFVLIFIYNTIIGSNKEYLHELIQNSDLIDKIFELAFFDNSDISSQSILIVLALFKNNDEQIQRSLKQRNIFQFLKRLLIDYGQTQNIGYALESIGQLIESIDISQEQIKYLIEEMRKEDLIKNIQELQRHSEYNIYVKSYNIMSSLISN